MILQSHIIVNSWVYLTNIPLPYTQGHIAQWLRASLRNGEGPGFKPWSGHFYYIQQILISAVCEAICLRDVLDVQQLK